MKVAVIGDLGVTGSSSSRMFARAGHAVTGYDTARSRSYPYHAISQCEFAVICVPTPEGQSGRADLQHVRHAIADLPDSLPVLVRSTVPPGTCDTLAGSRAGLLAHCPEFMYERPDGAWSESWLVPYLIVGGSQTAREFFVPRLECVFPGKIHQCPDTATSEMTKYVINLYWATKVTFVNEMAQIAATFGADWEEVRSAWISDPRVNEHYTTMTGVPPGFGGRCWPKDLAALLAHCIDYEPLFLKSVQEANKRFTEGSG